MEWFEKAFDEVYLDIYRHRDGDEANDDALFAKEKLSLNKTSVLLDLCCGAGRHSLVFSKMVRQVLGFDLSLPLLSVASDDALENKCRNLFLLKGNMLDLDIVDCFDAVTSFFNSFGYFESNRDHTKVLSNIHSSLKSGGHLLLDIMNKDYLIENLQPRTQKVVGDYLITEERSIDLKNSRVEKKVLIQMNADLTEVNKYIESVYFFSRLEIEKLLKLVGFSDIDFYGSSAGDDFCAESKRMLIVCRKKK